MSKIDTNSTKTVFYFNKCVYSNQHATSPANLNEIRKN